MPRVLISIVTMMVALAAGAGPATVADPQLTDAERAELIDVLERSKAEFDRLVAGAGGDAWARKPAPDRWSVGEVAEHLLLSEGVVRARVQAVLDSDPDADWQAAAALEVATIVATVSDRSQKFQAPERVQPKSELGREEVLARFAAARAETLRYVAETAAPLKQHTSESPVLGRFNAAHWLGFIAAHNFRHNQQIAEIVAATGGG